MFRSKAKVGLNLAIDTSNCCTNHFFCSNGSGAATWISKAPRPSTTNCGPVAPPAGFAAGAPALRQQVHGISRSAEAMGVFGVPSFIVDGELYWGQEHLDDIREILRRF